MAEGCNSERQLLARLRPKLEGSNPHVTRPSESEWTSLADPKKTFEFSRTFRRLTSRQGWTSTLDSRSAPSNTGTRKVAGF
jgi:hypothetical protein